LGHAVAETLPNNNWDDNGTISFSFSLAREFWRNLNGIGVKPEKRADISNASIGFSREMKFEDRLQKSILITRHFPDRGCSSDWVKANCPRWTTN